MKTIPAFWSVTSLGLPGSVLVNTVIKHIAYRAYCCRAGAIPKVEAKPNFSVSFFYLTKPHKQERKALQDGKK